MLKTYTQNLIFSFLLVVGASNQALAQDSITFIPDVMNYRPTGESTCTPKLICAINNTTTAIENPAFTLIGSKEFVIQDGFQDCPNPLPPNGVCKIYVDFCPQIPGEYQGILKFTGSDQQILMTGTGNSKGV